MSTYFLGTKEQCQATKNVIEESASTSKVLSRAKSASTAKSISTVKTSTAKSTSTLKKAPIIDATAISTLPIDTRSSLDDIEDENSTRETSNNSKSSYSGLISLPTDVPSGASICSQLPNVLKTSSTARSRTDLESSSDTMSEPPLVIDQATFDDHDDYLEMNPKDNTASTKGKNYV